MLVIDLYIAMTTSNCSEASQKNKSYSTFAVTLLTLVEYIKWIKHFYRVHREKKDSRTEKERKTWTEWDKKEIISEIKGVMQSNDIYALHFTDFPLQSLLFHWLAPCIDWNIELLHTDWCKVSLWYVSAIIKATSIWWGEEKLQNSLFLKKVERESKSPMSDLSQLTHSKHRESWITCQEHLKN